MSTKLKIAVAVLVTLVSTLSLEFGGVLVLGAYLNAFEPEPLPACQPQRTLRPGVFSDFSKTG